MQIRANRQNARKSTGPKATDRTRFHGLTHVFLPGGCRDEFDAERDGWHDDWRP